MQTLVLGLGNELLADEGVGVHVVRGLPRERLGSNVEVVEVGTRILDAMPLIAEAGRLIVVDAVRGGHPPGTVYRIPFEECARPGVIASMHGFDLSRVIALAGADPRLEAVVIGVEPATIDWSTELSAEVEEALPDVLEAVVWECRSPWRTTTRGSSDRAETPSDQWSPSGLRS
jgi:hydrogenase maturation protease